MTLASNKVLVICGPTSSGKTTLGLELAKTLDAVIISADSRQIYRYMDIGTGKIPVDNEGSVQKETDHYAVNGIKIYGYDLVQPDEQYSAYAFSEYARNLINRFSSVSKHVIVVGGTGFYIDVLTGRIQPSGSAPNKKLRDELNQYTLKALQEKLQSLSLLEFQRIDINNKVRLIRAIEKIVSSNPVNAPITPLSNVTFEIFGLKSTNPFMFEKVDKWAETVWKNGLVDETRSLLEKGFGETAPVNGLIYKSVKSYLGGEMSESEALQRVKYDLHAYIRRQLTWFKKNSDIHWYDVALLSTSQIKADLLSRFSV